MKIVISSALAMLLAATSLCAQQNQSAAPRPKMNSSQKTMEPFEQGYDLCADKFPAAYNAPARVDVRDCWDLFLTGSFLYWYVGQDGLELAVPANSTTHLITSGASIASSDQSYQPGFKVGLGINFDVDNWVGYVEYTWMHSKTKTSLGALATGESWNLANWYSNLSTSNSAVSAETVSSSWKYGFDMVDLVVSRPFYQGRKVTVSPYGGLKGFSLRQNFRVSAHNGRVGTTSFNENISHNKQKSWAIGLLTGMQTHWLLGAGFRMEGDLGLSLLYNKFDKLSSRADMNGVNGESSHVRQKVSTVRPTMDLSAGLGWGSYLDRQNYHFDMLFAYEFFLLPGQNMMRYVANENIYMNSAAPNDLFMHGLTAKLRFDF